MSKKITALLLAVLMVLSIAAFAGCSKSDNEKDTSAPANQSEQTSEDEKEPSSEANLPEDFTLIVGLDASFPPYGYTDDNGEIVGFDIDLAKEVAKRNGWEFKAVPIDWDSKDAELNSGNINCIWNGFTINGRENDYTWTKPYVDNSQVLVVMADSGIKTLADLEGKTVITQAGSSAESTIKDEENEDMVKFLASLKELTTNPDYNGAFMELQSGAADAVAMDVGVAKYQIESRGADKFVILDEVLAAEQYGVGFRLGDTAACNAVQKTLDEMKADGTLNKIAEEWDLVDALVKE